MGMDIRNWWSSGCRSLRLGRGYHELEVENLQATTRSGRPTWKLLWRKFLKEKRKLFETTPVPVQVPYDAYTYLQNFDQGLMWDDEPDILSRSFSVRFADPSRIFLASEVPPELS